MDILQQYFYKDDNSNTPTMKKKVHFEPANGKDDISRDYLNREKCGTQLKILMTKEEALRLLSKCRDGGGVLHFKDVANQLLQIPSNRVSVQIPSAKKDR